ncbi:MAG: hypothetical protein M3400_16920 [Actinomycetota bacterium]|nr:hypothetical protein [Actinomycetota bacterium]
MTDERRNDDSVSNGRARNVADILREAGVTSTGSGGRRRRRDESPEPTEEFGTFESVGTFDTSEFGSEFGSGEFDTSEFGSGEFSSGEFRSLSAYLLAPDAAPLSPTPAEVVPPDRTPPSVRPAQTPRPDVGPAETQLPMTPPPQPKAAPPQAAAQALPREVPRTDTGPVTPFGWAARDSDTGTSLHAKTNSSSASPSVSSRPRKTVTALEAPAGAPENGAAVRQARPVGAAGTSHANRSPSPLASSPAEDPEETDAALPLRGGVASWAILAVELLAALGLGVGAWYAFSALWELLPYVAAFSGPLVVTGLVAVAGALRARTGRNPLGLPTLCILVLAGMVLVVLPAATVIIP